jgi:hypothetical protein
MTTPLIVVCTHHKTGTVWMADVFRAIKKQFKLKIHSGKQAELPPEADIFLQDHSKVDLQALRDRGRPVRCVHVIRDPRDVVISGCFYHVKTTEKWANTPKAEFGGKNYRETISALPTDYDKLVFEMKNTGMKSINDMVNWNYKDPDVFEVRYEDLINDADYKVFRPMMRFLGFEGADLETVLQIVHDHSLFGGAKPTTAKDPVHVRSGESRQWPKTFTPELKAAFKEIHPDALQKLGYEKNADW